MEYTDAINYLQAFHDMERGTQSSSNPAMSLASVHSLLDRLGGPQHGRPTIHVTGSKGKGSIASMMEGVLRRAGAETALFTSPHLHSYRERIRFNGTPVDAETFAEGVNSIRLAVDAEQAVTEGAVSTFGILTALFFALARNHAPRVDWQVVEVGLGGTFDATNVFDDVAMVIIGPISLEHTAILGDTIRAIATDKAGLIKPGSVCVLAPQPDPDAVDVVRARCREVGAEFVDVAALYSNDVIERYPYGQSFHVTGPGLTRELRSPMLGLHQVENAMTVVAATEALRRRGHEIPERALVDGIARTRMHGRMEILGQKPLIVADGAHTPASAAALADTLRDYFEWRRCFFVLGCTSDKDIRGIGFKLAKLAEIIICSGFKSPRAADPYAMIQEVGFLGPPAVAEDTVADAIETALSHAGESDLICITGSLYVVAEARRLLVGQPAWV